MKDKKKNKWMWVLIALAVIFMIMVVNGVNGRNEADNYERKQSEKVEKKKAAKKQAKTKKEEEENFEKANSDLKGASDKTDGLVIDYKFMNGSLVLEVSDDVLSGSDDQAKVLIKRAWQYGQNIYNDYQPYNDKDWLNASVKVINQQGDELAETTAMRNIKYTI